MKRSYSRIVAVFVVGMIAGATLLSPASAHFGESIGHLTKHLKKTFFTKAQINARAIGCAGNHRADRMVRVGPICIDRYEASIWSSPTGGTQYGVSSDDYPCADNGQDCAKKIFARSVAGVPPSRFLTWFQAQAALVNSRKRLPTNAEWQMAAQGTPDPGASPGAADCNTNSSGPSNTGARANCRSAWGAHDMVGNVWEWVAEWIPKSTACGNWPAGYNDDRQCFAGADTTGAPGALLRGGIWANAETAGAFAVTMAEPSSGALSFGVRGAR